MTTGGKNIKRAVMEAVNNPPYILYCILYIHCTVCVCGSVPADFLLFNGAVQKKIIAISYTHFMPRYHG